MGFIIQNEVPIAYTDDSFSTLLSPTLLSACFKHIFHKPCRYEFYCVKVTVQGKVGSSYKYVLKSNSWRGKVCFNLKKHSHRKAPEPVKDYMHC